MHETRSVLKMPLPYKVTSLIRNRLLVGLCSSPVPRGLGWSFGRGGYSYGRGTSKRFMDYPIAVYSRNTCVVRCSITSGYVDVVVSLNEVSRFPYVPKVLPVLLIMIWPMPIAHIPFSRQCWPVSARNKPFRRHSPNTAPTKTGGFHGSTGSDYISQNVLMKWF